MDDRANVIVGGDDAELAAADPLESVPALIRDAGAAARFAWDEFLYGRIRNPFTRKAYLHSVRLFFRWMDLHGLDLVRVTPEHMGRYLDGLPVAAPTKKLHLAALRRFFDELVLRHVVVLNPALSVRSERHQVVEGKTPEISVKHARQLMHSIGTANEVGQRDRAVIGVLIYTAARVGAVARLCRRDFYEVAEQYCLRFHEKGGKIQEIPVRHDLQVFLQEYLERSGLLYADPSSPMFRTTIRKSKRLTMNRMTADDMARMMKRRLRDAGLSTHLSPHSLRVTTITDLLEQGVQPFFRRNRSAVTERFPMHVCDSRYRPERSCRTSPPGSA